MDQMLVNIGDYSENWKRWVVAWLVIVVVVALVTPLGFLASLTGTAGLYFVFHGILAIGRSVAARSVEETTVRSLAGRQEAVQVVGDAQPAGDPFTAPMSDTDCVAWEVRVKEFSPQEADGE